MNVLSLFDGISCGQIALERAGIKVDNYYASEIKPIAIKVTQQHYPNTIQLGDVTQIKGEDLPEIDLLIGGSPCQDFSNANQICRDGLQGSKSSLFYHYYRLLQECKPKYFLLENVRMKKVERDAISKLLGVEPIYINSSLLSAQARPRLYWTNIPNVVPPADKGITLNSILDNGWSPLEKSRCLLVSDCRPLTTPIKMYHRSTLCFTTPIFKSEQHYLDCKEYYDTHFAGMKAKQMVCTSKVFDGIRYFTTNEREKLQTMPQGYCNCLTWSEAADVLGDGWTVDVIAYIFSFLKGLIVDGQIKEESNTE